MSAIASVMTACASVLLAGWCAVCLPMFAARATRPGGRAQIELCVPADRDVIVGDEPVALSKSGQDNSVDSPGLAVEDGPAPEPLIIPKTVAEVPLAELPLAPPICRR